MMSAKGTRELVPNILSTSVDQDAVFFSLLQREIPFLLTAGFAMNKVCKRTTVIWSNFKSWYLPFSSAKVQCLDWEFQTEVKESSNSNQNLTFCISAPIHRYWILYLHGESPLNSHAVWDSWKPNPSFSSPKPVCVLQYMLLPSKLGYLFLSNGCFGNHNSARWFMHSSSQL